jgi:hypothetical protein
MAVSRYSLHSPDIMRRRLFTYRALSWIRCHYLAGRLKSHLTKKVISTVSISRDGSDPYANNCGGMYRPPEQKVVGAERVLAVSANLSDQKVRPLGFTKKDRIWLFSVARRVLYRRAYVLDHLIIQTL